MLPGDELPSPTEDMPVRAPCRTCNAGFLVRDPLLLVLQLRALQLNVGVRLADLHRDAGKHVSCALRAGVPDATTPQGNSQGKTV